MPKKKFERGVTASAFDLLHAGHMMMLKEAKEYCDHLTVFLQTDPTIDRPSKNRPVMSLEERRTMLEGVRYADDIQIYSTEDELYELLGQLPYDTVRIIGADWRGKKYTGWDLPLPVIFNTRNHNYSTTELRQRVYNAEREKMEREVVRIGSMTFNRRSTDRIKS